VATYSFNKILCKGMCLERSWTFHAKDDNDAENKLRAWVDYQGMHRSDVSFSKICNDNMCRNDLHNDYMVQL